MSGFLSRVAARAVGQAPVARPKVPSVFEGTRASSAEGGLEIVETQVAGSPSAGNQRALTADQATQPGLSAPPAKPAEPRQASARDRAEPTSAPARPRVPDTPVPGTAVPDTSVPGTAVSGTAVPDQRVFGAPEGELASAAEGPAADAVREPRGAEAESVAAVAAAVPAARATLVFASRSEPAARAAEARAVADTPTVRVHIGRLEVRANLHEAPSGRALRTEPEPAGQSLADYLRGRRAAS